MDAPVADPDLDKLAAIGGARPRITARGRARPEAELPTKSQLADASLCLVGWGIISSNTGQWIAAAAVADGASHPEVLKLSTLGASGTCSGNRRRDLLSNLCSDTLVPRPSWIWVPMKIKDGLVEPMTQLLITPTLLIGAIWNQFHDTLAEMFGDSPRSFWSHVLPTGPKLIH